MAQQILKEVDTVFSSFFALIKKAKEGNYSFQNIKLPNYLERDGYFTLIIAQIRIKPDMTLDIPMSPSFKKEYGKVTIKVPKNLRGKKLKKFELFLNTKQGFLRFSIPMRFLETKKN